MKKKFLFVCTGNTCRSSMAEAIFKDLLAEADKEGYQVMSAGLSALAGSNAASQAIQVMKEKEIDLTSHKSTPLTEELVQEADLILTMTQRHKLAIVDNYPETRNKVYTLKEYATRVEQIEAETEQIEELYEVIDQKRKEFLAEHNVEINELESKREELINQLEEVEERMVELEDELASRTEPEKKKLARLKGGRDSINISDPFGQPISVYRSCAQEIKAQLEKIVENLN